MSKTPPQTRYAEKLKDPRWQKKRLEVLNDRDWSCELCHDKESTLHVHHKRYEKGFEPWEYDLDIYAVLCENCHLEEHNNMDIIFNCFSSVIKGMFLSSQISNLAVGFNYMEKVNSPEIISSTLEWALQDKTVMDFLISEYLDSLKAKK